MLTVVFAKFSEFKSKTIQTTSDRCFAYKFYFSTVEYPVLDINSMLVDFELLWVIAS